MSHCSQAEAEKKVCCAQGQHAATTAHACVLLACCSTSSSSQHVPSLCRAAPLNSLCHSERYPWRCGKTPSTPSGESCRWCVMAPQRHLLRPRAMLCDSVVQHTGRPTADATRVRLVAGQVGRPEQRRRLLQHHAGARATPGHALHGDYMLVLMLAACACVNNPDVQRSNAMLHAAFCNLQSAGVRGADKGV
jgi:hypothetical protein